MFVGYQLDSLIVFILRRPFGHNQVSIYIDGVQNISAPAKFTPLTDVIFFTLIILFFILCSDKEFLFF